MNERSERAGLPGRKIWSIAPDPHAPDGPFYAGLGGGHLFHSAVLREALDIDAAAPCGCTWAPTAARSSPAPTRAIAGA